MRESDRVHRGREGRGRRAALLAGLLALPGCQGELEDHGRIRPLEPSSFFPDGRSARDPPPGTVPRGPATGLPAPEGQGLAAVDQLPIPLTRKLLERGRERYEIFCSVCHGGAGHGEGMIVRRGFTPPPTFHGPPLRQATLGHFVEVISNGRGAMYGYSDRVSAPDRWAIAAYIRALQFSQRAKLDSLPEEDARRAREAGR